MRSKTTEIKNTVTNYDGIAKRLLDNMDDEEMTVFINNVFSREYDRNSSVTRMATETYDRETRQKRCDYFVKIDNDLFLIEIQSYEDEEMALRIFEYGSRGAELHGRTTSDDDTIELQFPEPVVFYLRKGEKVHDRLSVRIHCSGSDEIYSYEAKVVYVEDYGMDRLIETGMLPLIPFYPMRYEKILERKHSEEEENMILMDFRGSYEILRKAAKQKLFGAEYYQYLKESMLKVFSGLVNRMKKSGKMKKEKEAKELMQKMVDEPIEMFDIFLALEESKEEGRTEGRAEGIAEEKKNTEKAETERDQEKKRMVNSIQSAMKKLNLSAEEAMDFLDISEEERSPYREAIL